MANLIKVTRAVAGDSVSAKVPFEAPQGLIVQFDSANAGSFKKADGERGFVLQRDVTAEGPTLSDAVFNTNLISPVKVGLEASARKVEEAEIEGDGLILLSGTGAISSGTAAGTELSTSAGRLYAAQSGDEVIGWVREQLTPQDSGNNVRIRVEFAG